MSKLDITKSNLYISEFLNARKGRLVRKFIPLCNPRSSDAFVFILEGSCRYRFDDGLSFEAKKGGILYLAKNAIYEMDVNCDKYDFFVINFEFMTSETRRSGFYQLSSPTAAEQLFSHLYYGSNTLHPSDFTHNMATLYKILTLANENAEHAYIGSKSRSKIETCAEYINLHFADETLSVSSLAKSAGFSEVYFRKLFLLQFGLTPSNYITRTRLGHAIKLMALDGLSLDDIAQESGFSSLPYFSKVFKSFIGESPAAYRRSMIKHSDIT